MLRYREDYLKLFYYEKIAILAVSETYFPLWSPIQGIDGI